MQIAKRLRAWGLAIEAGLVRLFSAYSLRQRFLVAPVVGMIICSLVISAFIYESRRQEALLGRIAEEELSASNRYSQVFGNLVERHTAIYDLLHGSGEGDEAALYDEAKQSLDGIRQAIGDLERALPVIDKSKPDKADVFRSELSASTQAYWKAVVAAVGMATVDVAIAPRQLAVVNESFVRMNRSFMRLLDLERGNLGSEIDDSIRQSRISSRTIGLVGISIAALMTLFSLALSRILSRTLEKQIDLLTDLGGQAGAFPSVEGVEQIDRMAGAVAAFKQSLDGITRLNRVHAMTSRISALIVRAKGREELFGGACRIAVEHGRFKGAAIGLVDRETRQVRLVGSAGPTEGFIAALRPRLGLADDEPERQGELARAVRERKAVVMNDVGHDPRVLHKVAYVTQGIGSMAVLPLLVADNVPGVMCLFAGEIGFFDQEEMKVLGELADEMGFAIDSIEKQERLDHLAHYDALTGLANRSLFLERVTQYLRGAAGGADKLAVCMIDIDRFRHINESLGRAAGDQLLKQVAEWFSGNMGGASFLARVGPDRFATVMPEVRKDGDLPRLFEKLEQAFQDHPFQLNGTTFRITAKAGIALFPDDGGDADTLLRNAEASLKRAKASGERHLFYTQKMTDTAAGKLILENQLRRAFDNEEFVLHYQPKVDVASRRLTSAEALIRWNDPLTGLAPPGGFIPSLEETGLIHDVGRWAMRKALDDYLRWRAAGLPAVRAAVNVSPLQLRHRGFVAEIERALAIDPLAASGLELEITESLVMEDVQHTIATLHAIREMGVTVAIDDFGTGFSSLTALAKLPLDTLKIHRSFVSDMTTGPQGLALVTTIIRLAHSLKLEVVAEGVETEEQARLLRLLGCDVMQGDLFSRPEPGDIFEGKFLAREPLAA